MADDGWEERVIEVYFYQWYQNEVILEFLGVYIFRCIEFLGV